MSAQLLQLSLRALPAKLNHLHRNGEVSAQAVHQLGLIGDDSQTAAGAGHHLFPQQSPAAAFDQSQRPALDFVRAVDS